MLNLGKSSTYKSKSNAFTLPQRKIRPLVCGLMTVSSLLSQFWFSPAVSAQTAGEYCQFTSDAIAQKEKLRQASLQGDESDRNRYQNLLKQHADALRQCRSGSWLKEQSIWLRLYPCDARPGEIDKIIDDIVNRGYNKIYVEVFYDGQALLPASDNPTPWVSVVRSPGHENVDLLAQAIQKAHERGIEAYAWFFTMNFGYTYAQREDRQDVLARNGKGQNSTAVVEDGSQVFIDPYHQQAKSDYYSLVQTIAKRRPDGMLFDYIRYPRGSGSESVISGVEDLWIYGEAAQQALFLRALNNKGRVLIERYIQRGYITQGDVREVDQLYPSEGSPLWQGRNPSPTEMEAPLNVRHQRLQSDLWNLTVAHAAQGVIDFLAFATLPAQRQGIPAGAVFFPDSNRPVGQKGFDSRLQPWDRFSSNLEWHPMSYGVCGENNSRCIVDQVKRVTDAAAPQTQVIPALAGVWGKPYDGRPSLEDQMRAIHWEVPEVNAISHFAYSWQTPERDRERKFCRL